MQNLTKTTLYVYISRLPIINIDRYFVNKIDYKMATPDCQHATTKKYSNIVYEQKISLCSDFVTNSRLCRLIDIARGC